MRTLLRAASHFYVIYNSANLQDDGQVSFGTVSANAQASSYEVRNEAQKDVKFKGILIQMAGVDKVLGVGSVMVEQPHTSGNEFINRRSIIIIKWHYPVLLKYNNVPK